MITIKGIYFLTGSSFLLQDMEKLYLEGGLLNYANPMGALCIWCQTSSGSGRPCPRYRQSFRGLQTFSIVI